MILNNNSGPSRWGWALLLLAFFTAIFLRLYLLTDLPPGLYRDEAFNGLDALGALNGRHAIFFTANNGREPAVIYLTALFVGLLGRTVTAVRLAVVFSGALTTFAVYLLAKEWFRWRVGLLAAWLWAITLWPVHLSRIGLRPILLIPVLTLTFWLGTLAYRRRPYWLWLATGLIYGVGFYTYLAVRFTPILLLLILIYMVWRRGTDWLWPGGGWFVLGTAVTLLPLALFYTQNLDLLLGRTDQVSIFNETINKGNFWRTLLQHIGRALGLFIWRGDTILRHNPAGRPLFDWLMIIPFFIGLGWCAREWKRPSAAVTLLWIGVMLGVTILAEDTPHFLRAVGILPAALFLPALGLAWLWRWPRLPLVLRQLLVAGLLVGSLIFTMQDYAAYGRQPETALLFETAAAELSHQIREEMPGTAVYLDRWFWDESSQKGWPSIPFLADLSTVTFYRPESPIPQPAPGQLVSIYAWPFGDLSFVPDLIAPPALVSVQMGSLARGDLEETAYPLYTRYHAAPLPADWPLDVHFADQFTLRQSGVTVLAEQTALVDLVWQAETAVNPNLVAFVHIADTNGLIGQSDAPVGNGQWQADWWQPNLVVHEQRIIKLTEPYDPTRHTVAIGLYDAATGNRLFVLENGRAIGDVWTLRP
ncbi:MAG: hypothetical protein GY796_29690 [Chloroflexi bacterium]|nr:hypothetical protein [Chloroflexota bacterium]